MTRRPKKMTRRDLLKRGAVSGGATLLACASLRPIPVSGQDPGHDHGGDPGGGEPMPTSPLVLNPFSDDLPIPAAYAPSDPGTWRKPDGTPEDPFRPDQHQIWQNPAVYYRIQLLLRPHVFTSSPVRPINAQGQEVVPPDGGGPGPRNLPESYVAGFNGTFPGPMIRAWYGQPCMVRFENLLDPSGADGPWGDFGVPSFLTHLHNGHTACESDGNPFHMRGEGYDSWHLGASGNGNWYHDNLYLNMVPDGDKREAQSFLWFHDHRMDNTSTNVAKGMVGLYVLHDHLDCNDETKGYRLPSGPYDIPLAFYDCRFDDGVTEHRGINKDLSGAYMQDGNAHPENWGRLFFAAYENHGYVGDLFTVNGKVQPVLRVYRRKYRFRMLDCSIARWYEFKLMKGTPVAHPGLQGQYHFHGGGQQCMQFVQIASEGGLLPRPIVRDSVNLAPAKRREVVVDFTRYMDGSPTRPGDVLYLTNTLQMTDGRKPNKFQEPGDTTPYDPNYAVPVLKIEIVDDPPTPDRSLILPTLRALPPVPMGALRRLTFREFELHRSGSMWMINGAPFDHTISYADIPCGSAEVWRIINGGGGWVHPLHIHQEEHHVLSRNGVPAAGDDISKEDVVALAPGEDVLVYRKFRTFKGRYVSHCHNLAHEDHAMMFGWTII